MSVVVWGSISASGVGDLLKIDGIMNAKRYHQIWIQRAISAVYILHFCVCLDMVQ